MEWYMKNYGCEKNRGESFMYNKIKDISIVALLLFLCCYFMQLFNFPNVLTLLFGGISILTLMLKQKRIRVDLETLLIVTTIASYFIIVYGQRAFTMSLSYVSIVIYVLAHYLGYEIKASEKSEHLYLAFVFAIVVGYSVRGCLNSYLFLDGQFQYPSTVRIWKDIWADWYMVGTWQALFFLPMFACVFPAIAYIRKRKYLCIILLAVAMFFLYISFASESRTSVVILVIIFVAQMFLEIILEWKRIREKISLRNILITVVVVIFLAIAILSVFKDNAIVVKFMSIMNRGGGILNNVRFKLQKVTIEQLFIYPMGGKQMVLPAPHPHPHNTWLDMAFMAGLIPFFAFLVYTVFTIYELIRWLFEKEISQERKIVTAGVYGVFFLYFMIERSFVGSVHYMTPWLFVNGLIHGELFAIKEKLKRQEK